MGKASAKFMIIRAALQEEDNQLDIQTMCQLVGVSRSGYYRWLNASQYRAELEEQDCRDFELILQAYNHRGYKKRCPKHLYEASSSESTSGDEHQENPQNHGKIPTILSDSQGESLSENDAGYAYQPCFP